MAFTRSRNTDASRSTFNDAGRDQFTNSSVHISNQTFHVHISHPTAEQPLHHVLRNVTNDLSLLTPNVEAPSPNGSWSLSQTSSKASSSARDIAAGCIIEIVQSLMDPQSLNLNHRRRLKLELEVLNKTLVLTGLAIQAYEYTPLGRNLANIINQEVEQCCLILQQLLDKINCYRQGLSSTSIRGFWRPVLWSGSEVDELDSLRMKLSARQKLLGECLMALTSVSWEKLGNGLRSSSISIRDFHACLACGPSSLHHIQVNKILVVDHLGRHLPVPTLFCSTWKEFDSIINGYCKDSVGNHFIERGDYRVIRAEDSQTIYPSKFAGSVESGMVLEMSILLRKKAGIDGSKQKCPRCSYINLNFTQSSGWIDGKCSGQFQVATAGENGQNYNDSRDENGSARDNDRGQEIISPASRSRGDNTIPRADNGDLEPRDDDGTQFFRRIQVIYANLRTGSIRVHSVGQLVGGSGGGAFDSSQVFNATGTSLREIRLWTGLYIDAIQLVQSRQKDIFTTPRFGGKRGNLNTFTLSLGEFVVRIEGRSGTYIDQLRFITNKGRTSPVYGGRGGSPFVWSHDSTAPSVGLGWFSGRCGHYVDSLRPHFVHQT